ncbi:hypothetical protein UY3_13873 [Chelonia mydas]|uniref:Uncharacterized protein n=1 Tax=Chelonia mydas TaxID=8469 RepID=M7BA51_CHEMY|nr:hypothetical protein UY3_13873 [Chelonia mydas]
MSIKTDPLCLQHLCPDPATDQQNGVTSHPPTGTHRQDANPLDRGDSTDDRPTLTPGPALDPGTENEKTLFNIHCKVQLLLESIKHCCGCENEGEIELADVSGQAKNLLQNQHCYASELLSEREICVLLGVTRGEGSSEVVFTPLLKDEGVINPKFLVGFFGVTLRLYQISE